MITSNQDPNFRPAFVYSLGANHSCKNVGGLLQQSYIPHGHPDHHSNATIPSTPVVVMVGLALCQSKIVDDEDGKMCGYVWNSSIAGGDGKNKV